LNLIHHPIFSVSFVGRQKIYQDGLDHSLECFFVFEEEPGATQLQGMKEDLTHELVEFHPDQVYYDLEEPPNVGVLHHQREEDPALVLQPSGSVLVLFPLEPLLHGVLPESHLVQELYL